MSSLLPPLEPVPGFFGVCRYHSFVTPGLQQGRYLRCRWQDYPYSPAPPGLPRHLQHVFLADEHDLAYGITVLRLARQIAARVHLAPGCDCTCRIDCRSGVAMRWPGRIPTIAGNDMSRIWAVLPSAPQTPAVGLVLAREGDGQSHRLPQEICAVSCSWIDKATESVYEAVLWPAGGADSDFSAATAQYFFAHPVDCLWVGLRRHRFWGRALSVVDCALPILDTSEMVVDFMSAVQRRVKGAHDGIR